MVPGTHAICFLFFRNSKPEETIGHLLRSFDAKKELTQKLPKKKTQTAAASMSYGVETLWKPQDLLHQRLLMALAQHVSDPFLEDPNVVL